MGVLVKAGQIIARNYPYVNSINSSSDDFPYGMSGLDGSSVFDAEIDDEGNLILTLQDQDEEMETHKILSMAENGVITKEMIMSIMNSINKLNRAVLELKQSPYHVVRSYSENHISNDYMLIWERYGYGSCQILISPFTGHVRITIDDKIYSSTFVDITKLNDVNLVGVSDLDHTIIINPLFHINSNGTLEICYVKQFKIELMLTDNEQHIFPTLLLQGNHFTSPEGGIITPPDVDEDSKDAITKSEISSIIAQVFNKKGDE